MIVRLRLGLCLFAVSLLIAGAARAQNADDALDNTADSSTASVDPALARKLASPGVTLRTFLDSADKAEWTTAVACLDLGTSTGASSSTALTRARKLKGVLDRLWKLDYAEIPEDPSSPWHLDYAAPADVDLDLLPYAERIQLVRDAQGLWRFSPSTVEAVDEMYTGLRGRPLAKGVTVVGAESSLLLWLEGLFPQSLQQRHFLIPTYRWILLLVLIFFGFAADLAVRLILHQLTGAWFRLLRGGKKYEGELRFWRPVGLLAQAMVWYGGISLIDLPQAAMWILEGALTLFAVIAGVWTGFRLIDMLATFLHERAKQTRSRFDDLLVPLVSRSLQVFVVTIGILTCAQAFSLPIAGLLGGLGLGGAALAFASKDAISNVFGSITVLTDRPFEIGDWIKTNDVEGTVETVGFRSTRIRTFYNSLITLPNSLLTTAVVDNMGKRRYRRISTTLGIQYDSRPEQIDAFCEGIRELIRRHPYTRKDYYHVYFNSYDDSSLGIMLYCFLECPDWSVELREKHRLFLDIFRLAEQLGVSFAFPTRTLHLYQEEAAEAKSSADISSPADAGKRLAARIAGPLLPPDERPGAVEFRGPSDIEENSETGDETGGR